jgi:hypothetical protein
MARRNQPAMGRGGGDTRPSSYVGPDDDDVVWQRPSGLRRAWAITRWGALVFLCGFGVAVSIAIAIASIVTLLGSSL